MNVTCSPPGDLSSEALGFDEVRLHWQPHLLATGYTIRGKELSGSQYVTLNISGGTTASRDVTLPDPNREYEWSIRSVCQGENQFSSYSQPDTVSLISGSCAPPSSLSITNLTSNSVSLNWTPVANAIRYEISGNEVGRSGRVTLLVSGANTSRQVNGLGPGRNYFWQVRAVCPDGVSTFSTMHNFTTPGGAAKEVQKPFSVPSWKIFPNPNSGNFNIELIGFSGEETEVTITDLKGNMIYRDYSPSRSSGILKFNIDFSDVFLISIRSSSFEDTRRVVVVR